MPNWGFNNITIEFPHKTIMENFLKLFYTYGPQYPAEPYDTKEDIEFSKKKRYTMNGIVPVPKEVEKRGYSIQDEDISFRTRDFLPPEKLDGYNFQVKYWGTKWDLSQFSSGKDTTDPKSIDIDWDNLTINFSCLTAWGYPDGFIRALLKEFPDVRFEGTFTEESDAYYGKITHDPITNQTEEIFPDETDPRYWEMRKEDEDLPYLFTEEALEEESVEELKSFYDMEQCPHCGKMFDRTSQMTMNGTCIHCGVQVLYPIVERIIAYRPDKK